MEHDPTPGISPLDLRGVSPHLLEISDKAHRISEMAQEISADMLRHSFKDTKSRIAHRQDHHELQQALGAKESLKKQLAQAEAKAAYYHHLLVLVARQRPVERADSLPTLVEDGLNIGTGGTRAWWTSADRPGSRDFRNSVKLRVLAEAALFDRRQ